MTAAVRERRVENADELLASHRAAPARARRQPPGTRSTARAGAKPKLRVLNQQAIRQRARRRNALLALFIIVLVGFFAVALIQAQLVADQQDLDVLRAEIAEVEANNARMAREVEFASSPAVIVERATELGMVRAYQPIYLKAVAPVRDVPNAPVFDPAATPRFELAAPQAVSADAAGAGISSSAPVSSAGVEMATGPTAVVESAPDPVIATTQSSVANTEAVTASPATVAPSPPLVGSEATATAEDGGSRFAGTRAVTGGPGSG